MTNFNLQIPITLSEIDGFTMTDDIPKNVRQSLVMLVKTIPGERLWDPGFGVGAREFLFKHPGENGRSELASRIRTQVATYLPHVRIDDIQAGDDPSQPEVMGLKIIYSIPSIGLRDSAEMSIS
jgi:phage baseplate assembly protein W